MTYTWTPCPCGNGYWIQGIGHFTGGREIADRHVAALNRGGKL